MVHYQACVMQHNMGFQVHHVIKGTPALGSEVCPNLATASSLLSGKNTLVVSAWSRHAFRNWRR